MRYSFGRQRSIRKLVIMIGVNFGVTDRLLRNWGACVDTIFLTCVKEGDFNEGKVADLKETKRCTRLKSTDGVRPMD